jgi:hypothetical protein
MQPASGEPADLAAAVEYGQPLPDGPGDGFWGYAILGVAFRSGDLLALRRFPVSSAGAGYTSVWHRHPDGRWTFYTDTTGASCARYFGPAVDQVVVTPIRIDWTSSRSLTVTIDGGQTLAWCVALEPTPTTSVVNVATRWLPERFWTNERALRLLGALGRLTLGTGRLRLQGNMPDGSRFFASPRRLWSVRTSRARIGGREVGKVAPLPQQTALGDFWIPARPLFATGGMFIADACDERHPAVATATSL